MLAVSLVTILAGTTAAFWSTGDQKFNLRAGALPGAILFGQAAAIECERAGRIETRGENAERQWMGRQRCFRLMCFDVLARELEPVWTLAQPDFYGFSFRVFNFPVVAQDTPDHPERADANRGRAVDERRTILRIV